METSLNSYLANSSPFKSDIGSLRGKIECLDTQRAGEVDFFEFKVLSDCCLDGRCWASSQVEIMAPTMLNAETLDLDSMLWGGPGVSKCPEKDRDDRHEECQLLQSVTGVQPLSFMGCDTSLKKEGKRLILPITTLTTHQGPRTPPKNPSTPSANMAEHKNSHKGGRARSRIGSDPEEGPIDKNKTRLKYRNSIPLQEHQSLARSMS